MKHTVLFTFFIASITMFAQEITKDKDGTIENAHYKVGYSAMYNCFWGQDKNSGRGLFPLLAKILFKELQDEYKRQEYEKIEREQSRKLEFRKAE